MPNAQWKRCGCHPAVRVALDIIDGSGLKANSRRVVERCISEDVSGAASGGAGIRQKLEGCLSTRIEIDPEMSKAIADISTVLATRPPVPNEVCNWNRCVYGPQAKCNEPTCVSMPLEQWKKCGCHPSVRSALDIITGSGLKTNSRKVVERCISKDASRLSSAPASAIATGLRKCVSTRVVIDESTSGVLSNIATTLSTQRASADDVCNWNRCVFGPTARCEGDQRVEVCDGVDNDSDGQIDEDASDARVWYKDDDGDGVGVPSEQIRACKAPRGYAATTGDCCDRDARAFPGQSQAFGRPSACGGYDFDCDGQATPETLSSHFRCGAWPECGTGSGWDRDAPKVCGQAAAFVESCTRTGMSCRRTVSARPRPLSCR